MNTNILQQLKEEGIIGEVTKEAIESAEAEKLFSVHWHLKTLLYLGVSLLSAGLGIYIYQHIDSIGHLTIVIMIGLIAAACLLYAFNNIPAFSREKVTSAGVWKDYILLLGCLNFLVFESYLQWQFNLFGERYGLATLIPTVILLFIAYRYDHLGVLTIGIFLFASWLGISLAPVDFFTKNDVGGEEFIYSGMILGAIFALQVWLHGTYNFKKHYVFTYANFAVHLGCIATLGAIMVFDYGLLWVPLFVLCIFLLWRFALASQSFYLVLCGVLYAYIGISYLFITEIVMHINSEVGIYLGLFYFIGSAAGAISLLKRLKINIQSL